MRTGPAVADATHLLEGTGPPGPRAAAAGPPAQRATWAEVDVAAIRANTAWLRARSNAPALLAAVKADGYGHGLEIAARAAVAGGADWLGVALVEEGAALRAAGIDVPVLLFAEPPVAAIPALLDAGLTPAAYSPAFLAALDAAAVARGGPPVGVHLKLDTGMRRVGVPPADWEDALRRVRAAPGLALDGLWSHLAVADEPGHPFTVQQAAAFRRGLALARGLGLAPRLAHLCNSAATLTLPDEHHDLVRPGIALYGLDPGGGLTAGTPLRPALALYSRLSLVKRLAAGEAVSYGLRWTAARATTVGTVPAGYADGVTRALTNRGMVLVNGRERPMVGTICMDQLLVDLGDDEARVGDEVVLLGEQGGRRVSAEDWASRLGTITYEVATSIGARVPRVPVRA